MAVKPTFFRRFKAVVLLVGSPVEGERHSAADKAFEMCGVEDISLQEALEGIFGGAGSQDEGMQARLDELERDNQMLADEVRRLQVQRRGEGYQDHCADDEYVDEEDKRGLRRVWSDYPQAPLGGLFCGSASLFVATTYWIPLHARPALVELMIAVLYLTCLLTFAQFFYDWISSEYKRHGFGVVFLKLLIVVGGIVTSVYAFFGTLVITDWPGIATNLFGAIAALIVSALLSISNAVPILIGKISKSQEQPFKAFREWFV